MGIFEKSKWIWLAEGSSYDQYAEFVDTVAYNGEGKMFINLSCDTDYTLFVNGAYVASNQYGDFEHYKVYDTVELTEFLREGENKIDILVYYSGISSSRYRAAAAGLIYEIVSGDVVVSFSNESVLSRLSPAYENGKMLLVSGQLGMSFGYDANKEKEGGYVPAVCVDKKCEFFARPIKKSVLKPRREMKNITRHSGKHWLIDLGGEVVGVPTLDIISDTEQTLQIAWGEDIADGGVRKIIHNRNFYYEYKTRIGRIFK